MLIIGFYINIWFKLYSCLNEMHDLAPLQISISFWISVLPVIDYDNIVLNIAELIKVGYI